MALFKVIDLPSKWCNLKLETHKTILQHSYSPHLQGALYLRALDLRRCQSWSTERSLSPSLGKGSGSRTGPRQPPRTPAPHQAVPHPAAAWEPRTNTRSTVSNARDLKNKYKIINLHNTTFYKTTGRNLDHINIQRGKSSKLHVCFCLILLSTGFQENDFLRIDACRHQGQGQFDFR